jgi:hypothetical protein
VEPLISCFLGNLQDRPAEITRNSELGSIVGFLLILFGSDCEIRGRFGAIRLAFNEMQLLLKPRFIALDSSHVGDIARDRASMDVERKRAAQNFQRAFDASNNILLLSWHHIEELLSYQDERVVVECVAYLRSLPLVASVRSVRGDDIIGGIIDVLAFEVRAAFNAPAMDAAEIRDVVAPGLCA